MEALKGVCDLYAVQAAKVYQRFQRQGQLKILLARAWLALLKTV
ncbi:MAG: hypothetical protein JCHSAcid_14670 [uncultured Acidilobus sp. JCHS]|jgi:hypothetical protein|nr:MAG: hypothetical protein JCHSAcid_14670 [uncultured Acidilobus sp. JCHS]ESQ25499.1 MAG: hypothetical protein OSP8Acid_08150 [uncultured Acidilobus sp. OSP8]